MAVWSECSNFTTPSACECTGPPLAKSDTALVVSRKREIRPVAQARCDRRGDLDRADAAHRASGQAEVVEHVEVFQERGLDVDRQGVDLAAPFGGRDLDLFVGQRWNVEELRNPLAPLDFDEKNLA